MHSGLLYQQEPRQEPLCPLSEVCLLCPGTGGPPARPNPACTRGWHRRQPRLREACARAGHMGCRLAPWWATFSARPPHPRGEGRARDTSRDRRGACRQTLTASRSPCGHDGGEWTGPARGVPAVPNRGAVSERASGTSLAAARGGAPNWCRRRGALLFAPHTHAAEGHIGAEGGDESGARRQTQDRVSSCPSAGVWDKDLGRAQRRACAAARVHSGARAQRRACLVGSPPSVSAGVSNS